MKWRIKSGWVYVPGGRSYRWEVTSPQGQRWQSAHIYATALHALDAGVRATYSHIYWAARRLQS